jgi:hypothetical protein
MDKNEALKMAIEFINKSQFESGGNYYVNRDKTINACKEALEQPAQEVECSNHPDAPHGFCRDASHSAGRYVCECEGWQVEQPAQEPVATIQQFERKWIDKEALEQSAQEPVGYLQEESPNGKGFFATYLPMKDMKNKPLYTHPHQWQGLSSNELELIEMKSYTLQVSVNDYEFSTISFYEGIEQALKEKNYG